jgi:hypothetical protein
MAHPTPTKDLLTTTLQPLAMELSGSLAHGARLVAQFLEQEPSPEKMMRFERELGALLCEVGRRILAWVLNRLEPERDEEAPSELWFEDRPYRRRHQYRGSIATVFGTVEMWRRLYEPRVRGVRSIHPLEIRLGIEAALATPALADRIGRWAADHSQNHVLSMLEHDHGVKWSCTSLRKVVSSLGAGLAEHRQDAQVDQVVQWREQARASDGHFRPTLSVGRDGVFVPIRQEGGQEGAAATVSVLDRRGKRLGTVYLGHLPESGQGTLTTQLSALLKDILTRVDSRGIRLAYVTDEGYHPSDYYHQVLKKMLDPRRPWRTLEWRRMVDYYHACGYVQQLAEAIWGTGKEAQDWAKEMRHTLKTKVGGVSRVLKSASGLRRGRGLWGTAKAYDQAYGYLKKRSQWMQYQSYRRQKLPIGAGITEAACKVVFTQRLKRSGMAWTIEGGQVILDLRVIWLSGVWDKVYHHYLAAKPRPATQAVRGKDEPSKRKAA